ncbi:hypothetical protein [Tepidimonas sp.]|uniref:hypothetical protein n=1 Tax=Tepidimonas sp. TaxID=2002775 RepID=UPI002FE0D66C
MLRLAVLLRDRFSIELQAHKCGFDALREQLVSTSFIALQGQRLALRPSGDWRLLDEDAAPMSDDALIVHLDPHLAVIRDGFALPDREMAGQLDLFSLPKLHGPASTPADALGRDLSLARRRSA